MNTSHAIEAAVLNLFRLLVVARIALVTIMLTGYENQPPSILFVGIGVFAVTIIINWRLKLST